MAAEIDCWDKKLKAKNQFSKVVVGKRKRKVHMRRIGEECIRIVY